MTTYPSELDQAMMAGLDAIAVDVIEWHDREWPSPDGTPAQLDRIALKLAEEVGELAGAIVKHVQGRTDADWLANATAELGDVAIVLMVLAGRLRETTGISLGAAIAERWGNVQQRRGAHHRGETA